MAATEHFGSVLSSDPRAAAQAASIGATIGHDGWWYAGPTTPGKRQGERLLPEEADALVQQAGTAITSTDDAHDKLYRDKEGRAIRGDLWKQGDRSRPAAMAAGTALVAGGVGALAAGGGAAAGAGAGSGGGLGTGASGFTMGSGAAGAGAGAGTAASTAAGTGGIWGTVKGIGSTVGDMFKKPDGSWDWEKIGGAAKGALGAYQGFQNEADSKDRLQMERDRMLMTDRQFEANYGLSKAQAMAQVDEFNVNNEFAQGKAAQGLQSNIDMAPLRDQAQYLLKSRMGAAPVSFTARDITKGTSMFRAGASGGPDLGAMQKAAAGYTSGAGGVNVDIAKQLQQQWMHPTPVKYNDPGTYTPGTGMVPPPAPANSPSGAPRTAVPAPAAPSPVQPPPIAPSSPAPALPPGGGGLPPTSSPGGGGGPDRGVDEVDGEELQNLLMRRMGGAPRVQ